MNSLRGRPDQDFLSLVTPCTSSRLYCFFLVQTISISPLEPPAISHHHLESPANLISSTLAPLWHACHTTAKMTIYNLTHITTLLSLNPLMNETQTPALRGLHPSLLLFTYLLGSLCFLCCRPLASYFPFPSLTHPKISSWEIYPSSALFLGYSSPRFLHCHPHPQHQL